VHDNMIKTETWKLSSILTNALAFTKVTSDIMQISPSNSVSLLRSQLTRAVAINAVYPCINA